MDKRTYGVELMSCSIHICMFCFGIAMGLSRLSINKEEERGL